MGLLCFVSLAPSWPIGQPRTELGLLFFRQFFGFHSATSLFRKPLRSAALDQPRSTDIYFQQCRYSRTRYFRDLRTIFMRDDWEMGCSGTLLVKDVDLGSFRLSSHLIIIMWCGLVAFFFFGQFISFAVTSSDNVALQFGVSHV